MQVLSALRQAATKDTKLLILSTMTKHACPETEDKSVVSAAGSSISAAPYPLSPQYMAARQSDAYTHDIIVSPNFKLYYGLSKVEAQMSRRR